MALKRTYTDDKILTQNHKIIIITVIYDYAGDNKK